MTQQINLHGFAPEQAERILQQAQEIRQGRKNGSDHCAKSVLKAQIIYILEAESYGIDKHEVSQINDGLRQVATLAEAVG